MKDVSDVISSSNRAVLSFVGSKTVDAPNLLKGKCLFGLPLSLFKLLPVTWQKH
jgi:hypothetical protein